MGKYRAYSDSFLRDADEQRFRATMATWTRLAALLLCAPVSAQFGNLEVKWQKDETSKDAVPSMGPPEPEGRLDGQNRATNLQGLSSEGLEGIVKSFGLSCDTCTNAGHWISRVRSGGAHVAEGALVAGLGVTLPPSLLPRSPRNAAAPAQVAPQKARAQVRQMLAARVTRHVTRAPACTPASLPRVAAGRPHGLWHAHPPIHPSRLTPRGPAHSGTMWMSCSTSAICRSCELSCTVLSRSLKSQNVSARLLGALRCTQTIGTYVVM
jgi:hypothetical protein